MNRWLSSFAIGVLVTSCNAEVFVFDEDSGFPSVSASSCSVDAEACPLTTLHCDPASGLCFECVYNSDCLMTAEARVCDPTAHRCVQCESPSDCGPGETCELSTLQCVPTCPDGGECPGTLMCSSQRHLCLGCMEDSDCMGDAGARKCNKAIGKCVECFLNQQCSGETPVCNYTQGECVQCLSGEDCTIAHPVCDPGAHQCVAL